MDLYPMVVSFGMLHQFEVPESRIVLDAWYLRFVPYMSTRQLLSQFRKPCPAFLMS